MEEQKKNKGTTNNVNAKKKQVICQRRKIRMKKQGEIVVEEAETI